MKIAITAQGSTLEAALDPRFGRCEQFIIVDLETGDHEAFPNDGAMAPGGAGTQAALLIADKDAAAVITGHVGPNAARSLQAAGIKVYSMASGTVGEAVAAFKQGELPEISGSTVRSHFGLRGQRGRLGNENRNRNS
ncbi:MAG: NifB/NifX family molybdenum-iron cluster-binding protein [Limnochordia bacterium]|nr:dinitrogenase iron-molybdenum cofactor biosynthesis protein [Bacillota bacterium]